MKHLIKATLAVAFIAVAGYTAYNSQKEIALSDLAMENVEALAGGESGGKVDCCPDPGDECKLSSGDVLHGQDEC